MLKFSRADIQKKHTPIITMNFVSRLWKEVGAYLNKMIMLRFWNILPF